MKIREIDKQLLLKSSGELGTGPAKRLEKLLAEDRDVRSVYEWNRQLMQTARCRDSEAQPNKSVKAAILGAAPSTARSKRTPQTTSLRRVSWRPAIYSAAAAVLLIFAGILVREEMRSTPSHVVAQTHVIGIESELDEELRQLDELATTTLLQLAESVDADRDVDAIANELIYMEDKEI